MNVNQREVDSFEVSSLSLSLIDEVGATTGIDDLRRLQDGQKILIEVAARQVKMGLYKSATVQSKSVFSAVTSDQTPQ